MPPAKPDLRRLLDTTRAHVEAKRDAQALATLVEGWRGCRHPRLADAVDRVSERLPHDPVTGKSVKERTASWLALAAKSDPTDLGRLLATPWPGTWQAALPVLAALRAMAHDPRVAMALCRLLEATPYDTYTSHRFYGPLLGRVQELADLRALPLLETDLSRVRSSYWRQGTHETTKRVVAALKKLALPTLTKPEETALGALEALFAGRVSALTTVKKSEAAFLADIYAAPDDDAPRAVYADWLSEKSDPRGELILVQLTQEREGATDELRARERALLKKHAKAWLGSRELVLEKGGRAFRRGFLARGTIELESGTDELGPELRDPAWSTLETLSLGWRAAHYHGEAILGLPWFAHVGALRAFPEALIAFLARGGPHEHLRELDFALDRETREEDRARIWEGRAFPGVRHVALEGELDGVRTFLAGPLARRLERLTHVDTEYALGPLVARVEAAGLGGLREVGLVSAYRDRKSVWQVVLRRDEAGRFRSLHAEPDVDATGFPSAPALCAALDSLEAGSLDEITVSSPFPCDFQHSDLLAASASLARFPAAKLDVPWEQLRAAEAPAGGGEAGAPVTAYYTLEPIVGPKGKAFFDQLGKPPLSLGLDAYEIYNGRSGKLTDLRGKAPFDLVKEAFAKKRTYQVTLVEKTSPDVRVTTYRERARLDFLLSAGKRGAFLDWALATERLTGDLPIVPFFARDPETGDLRQHDPPHLGPLDLRVLWLIALGPDEDAWIPLDALGAAAGQGPLAWLEVRRPVRPSDWRILLVLGASPTEPPGAEQLRALVTLMFELLWKTWKKKLGFLPHEHVVAGLAPLLEARGFARVAPEPDEYAHLERHFVRRTASGTSTLRLQFGDLASTEIHVLAMAEHYLGRPAVDVHAPSEEDRRAERTSWLTDKLPIGGKASGAKAVEEIAAQLEGVALPWYEQFVAAAPKGSAVRSRGSARSR